MTSPSIWYVSYGSNLLRERFMYYIVGGHLKAYARDHQGCPDKTPPSKDVALEIPGRLFFASHTDHWQGFTAAFIDPARSTERVKARAYLITLDQFQHILAQECGTSEPIPVSIEALRTDGSQVLGNGKHFFSRLVYLGEREGHPLITFTSPMEHMTAGSPSAPYLDVLVRGLMETHGITQQAARKYFMSKT
jgi:hypothetical protein